MKIQFILFTLFFTSTVIFSQKTFVIGPSDQVEVSSSTSKSYNATLKNLTMGNVDVAVLSLETGEQVSGFGLGRKATVYVEAGSKLILKNVGNRKTRVSTVLKHVEAKKNVIAQPGQPLSPKVEGSSTSPEKPASPALPKNYIEFTLENKSLKSIPLIIPTVMNPNLSPMSKSGVSLKIGQEILFRYKGKKRVLLVVSNDIKDGDVLDVKKILEQRKKEIRDKK